ncbi:MAG TPA: hypothetical protein VM925_16170 [Labilithrix sp.]|nr:hypothetical protein [Labilithrix sp.]
MSNMTADELLETMRAALAEEREGILRFDAAVVARANDTKQSILARLQQTPAEDRAPLLAALDELQPSLRCNLILLTHARTYLRDAQQAKAAAAREPRRSSSVIPRYQVRKTG